MPPRQFCDGLNRRDCLRLGAAGLFGLTWDTSRVLQAQAASSQNNRQTKEVSLLFVFLHGGLSTIDTFDLKPDAPAEFRGEFQPISTRLPGIQIGEHVPKLAAEIDKYSLIRSFRHHNSDHGAADHYILTGYFPTAGFNSGLKPNNQRPAHGSIIARKLGPKGSVPPYVCLPKMHPSAGPAYLGSGAAPFAIEADPNAPNFQVPDIVPPPVIQADRLDNRQALLRQLDRYRESAEVQANRHAQEVSTYQREAFSLMTSASARRAFDIQNEPANLRDQYGRNSLGQSCLMGRRLIEAGVRCVTIDHSNWDTHDGNFAVLKNSLLPMFDSAIGTLFRDLHDRGLLDSTMVVITGEFGRTPRINKNAGRDHWARSMACVLAGGGIKRGYAHGTTDSSGMAPATDPVTPDDLAATIFNQLGVDPYTELQSPTGRPMQLFREGKVVEKLIG